MKIPSDMAERTRRVLAIRRSMILKVKTPRVRIRVWPTPVAVIPMVTREGYHELPVRP